ncbi:MAG: restriction endonuclease [Tunicatimonas sp.]|uniref:restriction endonuclease n=1 Tax=Tunicatimonas sp. TaxID=1940096 RepID=UPI003C71BC71
MAEVPEGINAEITPREFEELIYKYLAHSGEKLNKFKSSHDEKIERTDGTYQIDVYVEFEALGGELKVLIECKRYKNKIKREIVQLLYDKIRSIGAHKGMIFATSCFQSGSIQYAEDHGIALIRVIEGRYTYVTKSQGVQSFEPPPWANIPKFVGEYKYGNYTSYLQHDHLEPIKEFLFNK